MHTSHSERRTDPDAGVAAHGPFSNPTSTHPVYPLSLCPHDASRMHYVRTTTLVYRIAPYPFDIEPMFSVALYRQVSITSTGSDGGGSSSPTHRCDEEDRSSRIDAWMPSPGDGLFGRLCRGVQQMRYDYAVQHRQRIFDECFGRQIAEHTHESARVLASAKAELLTLGRRRVVMVFLTNGALYFTTEWHFSSTSQAACNASDSNGSSSGGGGGSKAAERASHALLYQNKPRQSSSTEQTHSVHSAQSTSVSAALQSVFGRNAKSRSKKSRSHASGCDTNSSLVENSNKEGSRSSEAGTHLGAASAHARACGSNRPSSIFSGVYDTPSRAGAAGHGLASMAVAEQQSHAHTGGRGACAQDREAGADRTSDPTWTAVRSPESATILSTRATLEGGMSTENDPCGDGYRHWGSSRSDHIRERVSLCSMASVLPSVTFDVYRGASASNNVAAGNSGSMSTAIPSSVAPTACSAKRRTGGMNTKDDDGMDTLYIQGVPSVCVLPSAAQVFTVQPQQIFQIANISDVFLTVPKSSATDANRPIVNSVESPVVTLFSASSLFGEVLTPSEYRLARCMPYKLDGLVFNTVLIRAWHTRLQERGLPLLNPLVEYAKQH